MGRVPVTASILSQQELMSATISSAERLLKWAWLSEWHMTSWPASARAFTDSGYFSTQSPTTKKVTFTLYWSKMSMRAWVSSLPQGNAIIRSLRPKGFRADRSPCRQAAWTAENPAERSKGGRLNFTPRSFAAAMPSACRWRINSRSVWAT